MLKVEFWRRCQAGATFFLSHDGVADIAIFAYHLSFRAYMLTIMAAKASVEIEVAQIVGVGLPVQLHLGEGGSAEDLLNLFHRVTNFELLGLCNIGIFAFVESLEFVRDSLHGGFSRIVF